jgi:hypothetical protein
MRRVVDMARLPGGDLVSKGLADLLRGDLSAEALLALIGRPRLVGLGVEVPARDVPLPEHALYELLARDDVDSTHGRYNALLRRLVRFERALACAS